MSARPSPIVCLGGGIALLSIAVVAGTGFQERPWHPPSAESVRRTHLPSDARLEARDGQLLQEVRIDPTRRVLSWTPLDQISPALVAAVLRSEDQRFFTHGGVDPRALAAAAWQRLSGGVRRGASTISMQLVALLDRELRPRGGRRRTWPQKIQQMRSAWALEQSWAKEQILEAYLNLVPFRGEVEGVTAAAGALLAKSPHGIDAAEAVILAGLLRAPSAPPALAVARARRLARDGGIPLGEDALARAADRIFAVPNHRGPTPRLAPHLARRLLTATRGSGPATVRATLDAALQRTATAALERELASVRSNNVRDGAVVVLDNASGDVLVYVGSSGAGATSRHVDGARARRQAGSTLKPFLYGLALDRRILTAASLLDDSPVEIPVGDAVYRPRNYDERFRGSVTLRTALASSLNVPAVRTQQLLGEPAFIDRLVALGFTGLVTTGDHYGPSLTLGTAEVSLMELANAYRTLARGGVATPVRLTLDAAPGLERRVYSEEASFVIGQILSDREARSATFGLENALATRFWSAVKTGTSKEMRDNWCVGFSSEFTVAVWVGNYSGEPMHEVSGITGAAPTWLRVMSRLHRDHPSVTPTPPSGVLARRVSFPGGQTGREWFLEGTEPAGGSVAHAAAPTQIIAPVDGAVLVLDPDIPQQRQRIALVASPGQTGLAWRLDEDSVGAAQGPVLWAPRAGRHRLRLENDSGEVIDEIRFRVRTSGIRAY